MVAAPLVVARSALCWSAGDPAVLRRAVVAMLGTYAIGLVIREIVRGLLGGLY